MSGPPLRATGVPYDVRRAHPYSVYPELEFDVPTRTDGDSYARYLLHVEEIKQSLRIIDQVLHQMPDGPVMAKLPRLLRVPPGRAFIAIESPRGQYSAYAHQRRLRPAVPAAHPRPVVLQPAVGRVAHAGPPRGRHHGDHGQPRPDHGRRRQVTTVGRLPGTDSRRAARSSCRSSRCSARRASGSSSSGSTGIGPCWSTSRVDTGEANIDILRFLVAATAILLFTVPTAFVIIFFEMKIIAFVNLRVGPNRVGPWGTLSSTIHGLKVLAKEDFTPTGVDVPVFTLAPAVVYLAAIMTLLVIPFAPGVLGYEMELGLLYFFAVGGLGVIGLMMAGWSSFNKYSLLGGLRAAAAIISYELPLILGVIGVVLIAGTLNLQHDRGEPGRLVPRLVHLPAAPRGAHLLHRRHGRGLRARRST